jgi:hypothetical protein
MRVLVTWELAASGSPGKPSANDLRDEAARAPGGLRVRLPVGYVLLQVVGVASVRLV